ncbi:MAG: HlyD family efflux transporter periplasmic adaptor subunit [Sedimentisphaerales bacterium]|nr:HlyD family efflux transporter periplasmic adaptor subunit [Sedimentisphaerales bacterium]
MDNQQNNSQLTQIGKPTDAELIKQLEQFDGSAVQFLTNLLAVQCQLSRADSGAILRNNQQNNVDVLAIYPGLKEKQAPPLWLNQSAELIRRADSADKAIVKALPLQEETDNKTIQYYTVLVPLKMSDMGPAMGAFLVRAGDNNALESSRGQLELTAGLLDNFEKRLAVRNKQAGLISLQKAMETLSAINRQKRFLSTVMSLCNEAASQWQCERVSIGFLKGRYVRLKAMSHTEDFSRKMQVVQDIESVMEECFDQDCEVLYPASPEATYISRAAGELSKGHGPLAVLSVPLRWDGEVRAVLTLERESGKPFTLEEIEVIRLACELCTARLLELYEHDRWIGAKVIAKTRDGLALLVGPRYTWTKILVILISALILFLIFAKGQFRAEAPFALEATYQQVVCASFDGYIKNVNVEVGDAVKENDTILAELDTAELRLQLAAVKAEQAGYLKQVAAAMRDSETAEAQIAQANSDKAQAQIDLYNYLIEHGKVISPISGVVVKGDLKRQIGAPVKTGDVLFEVTPLESLRAELLVPEDQIFDIAIDQKGYLATVSYPSQRIKFVVERINPMAEVVNNRNVFKVRVRLLETLSWMRPGMEGIAKVSIGKRRYVWIWTRRVVNWLRMKLWL